jgi:G3E family GTPase
MARRYNRVMSSVPALLVTGIDSDAKYVFLSALFSARPPQARWALLDNDGGHLAQELAETQVAVAVAGGCACCSGQVALQTGIVRLLRESRPQRLVIVAAAAAEPLTLARALHQQQLSHVLRIDTHVCIVVPDRLATAEHAARLLWQRQMAAADQVLAPDSRITPALLGATPASSASSPRIVS